MSAAGPRDPRAGVRSLGRGEGQGAGQFLIQLGMGSQVSQSLCWPVSGQGQGPAGPRAGSGLLWAGWGIVFFLHLSGVWPLVGGARLEVCTGFLEGRASDCPLVGGAGSWPSGGLGCV